MIGRSAFGAAFGIGLAVALLLGTASSACATNAKLEARFDEVVQLLRDQDFERALNAIDTLLHDGRLSDKDLARALRYEGTAYLLSGLHGKALAAFSSALEIRPSDPWLLWRRCEVNGQIGFLASARRDCRDASRFLDSRWTVSLDPAKIDYLAFSIALTEAEVHRKLGAHDRAIARLKAMKVGGDLALVDWRRQETLATLHFDIENFEAAVTHLDAAIEGSAQAPAVNRAFLHFVRAASLDRLKRQDESAQDFAEATALDPKNELYLFRACNFALNARHRTLADSACTSLVTLFPEKTIYQRVAAINEALAGRFADALSRFRGVVPEGQEDSGLLEAIVEAAAYAASCDDGSEAECTVADSD